MKYFYDTEFLEDGHTFDLISIGIVAEDGREYYAVSKEADWDRINSHSWLSRNVVPQLPPEREWQTREEIREGITQFMMGTVPELWAWFSSWDHVCLMQLWGSMMDQPRWLPMYTHDARSFLDYIPRTTLPPQQTSGLHDALEDARHVKRMHDYMFDRTNRL